MSTVKNNNIISYPCKIFNISLNKTATKSTATLLSKCGIRSVHSIESPFVHIDKFDAFSDSNYNKSGGFKKYYDSYPNSLFLLNTRPLQDWIYSRFKHCSATLKDNETKNWGYPPTEKLALSWINQRRNHHRDVLDFFEDKPSQLLVCNINNPDWQKNTLKFLQIEKRVRFIQQNKRSIDVLKSNICDNIIDVVTSLDNHVDYDKDELLFPNFDLTNYSKLQILL